jgi:hypothetical protein
MLAVAADPTTAAPLAHDADGKPLALPPEAVGWRVRRPVGGRGRPRVVYNATGSPMRLRRGATLEDLRAGGCPPGVYHLDAVDRDGNPLGVTAYTELADVGDEDDEPASKNDRSETRMLLETMTRTFEAMQRAAVERDHALAGILTALGQRFAAPLEDVREVRKTLHEERSQMAQAVEVGPVAAPAAPTDVTSSLITQLMPTLTVLGQSLCYRLLGMSKQDIDALVLQQMQAQTTPAPTPPPAPPASDLPPELAPVVAELTPDEATTARALWAQTAEPTRKLLLKELAKRSPREAADFVRQMLRGLDAKVRARGVQ